MRTRGRTRAAAIVCALPLLAMACGRSDAPAPADGSPPQGRARQALPAAPPVVLPDLARMTGSARSQIEERFAQFQKAIADPGRSADERAGDYGDMGKLFLAASLLPSAEAAFLNAAALTPRDWRWSYYLGHVYKQQGAVDRSIAAFEQARQVRPDDFATLIWLGESYLGRDEPDRAEPLFARALSAQPRSAAALAGLGRAALAKRDYARAVQLLEESLTLNSRAAVVHYAAGMAYRGLGQHDKADAHLKERGQGDILVDDPLMQEIQQLLESATAFESLGIRALANNQPGAAADYFRRGLALEPDSPSLHQRLGTALYLTGDVAGARAQFEDALRLAPAFAPAHYAVGVLLAAEGRYEDALARFSTAARHDPNYIEPRLQMADILRHTGRAADALPIYAAILDSDGSMSEARLGEAFALIALGRYRDARRRLEAAVEGQPNQPALAHVLARILAAAPDTAERDGARALELVRPLLEGVAGLEVQETMAMALAETRAYAEAVALQRRIIEEAASAGRADLVPRLEDNLRRYERRLSSRRPWPHDELP